MSSQALINTAGPLALAALVTYAGKPRPAPREFFYAGVVFAVTAAWDVVLRLFSTGELRVFGVDKWRWVADLNPYFERVGVIEAAAVAGAVGVMGYSVIRLWRPGSMPRYALWVFTVSALVGLPMRLPPWFRDLRASYYDRHRLTTLATDGLSGLIVMATMLGSRWAWKTVFRRASLPRAA